MILGKIPVLVGVGIAGIGDTGNIYYSVEVVQLVRLAGHMPVGCNIPRASGGLSSVVGEMEIGSTLGYLGRVFVEVEMCCEARARARW